MTYIIPRAVIVLLGWGITCGLIITISPAMNTSVFYFAGISWALAGMVCFGYIRKLRRDAEPTPLRDQHS